MGLYKRCECGRARWQRCEHGYWYRFKHRGQLERGPTGQRHRTAAEKAAREARVEIERTAGPPGRRRGLALEVLEALDIKRVQDKGFREARERDIEGLWSPMFRLLGGPARDVTTLTEAELEAYEGTRRREDNGRGGKVRGQTIRRERQALKRAIARAVRDKLIRRSPIDWSALDEIDSDEPDERQASKPWTAAEIRTVRKHLSRKAVKAGILDLMEFADLTGLRLEEIARYERAVWLRGRDLHVPPAGAKTGKPRVVPLKRRALTLAKKWPRFEIGKPNKALLLACVKAGLAVVDERGRLVSGKVLTPRDLRAHRITEWAKKSLIAAQRLAGHTSVATTSRYLHPDADLIRRTALAGEKGARVRGHREIGRGKKAVKSSRARSSAG